MNAPLPPDEKDRLQTLRGLGLLDTEAEERYDRITRLAQTLFDVPITLISLVDSDRQWFKSKQGLDVEETAREVSFCAHAILGSEVFEVPDATKDERFQDNPLVTAPPDIRFYAGAPIAAPDGRKIGTLCLIDRRPRSLSAEQKRILKDLSTLVENEIAAAEMSKTLKRALAFERKHQRAREGRGGMTTSRKAAAGFGLALIVMLGLVIVSYVSARRFIETTHWMANTQQALENLSALSAITKEQQARSRNYALTGDSRFLQTQKQDPAAIKTRLFTLRRLIEDPLNRRRLDEIERMARERESAGVKPATAASSARKIVDGMRARVVVMEREARRLLAERAETAEANTDQLILIIGVGGLAAIIIVILSLISIRLDIAAREVIEHEADYINARLRAILDSATHVAIIVTDLAGTITVFNTGAERLFGYAADEVVGKLTPRTFLRAEGITRQTEEISRRLGRRVTEEQAFYETARLGGEYEWVCYGKDGVGRTLSVTMAALGQDARMAGTLAIGRDITEKKRIEAELVQARDAALSAARFKSDFLANMSHEIRTPMNAIIGMTTLLLDTKVDPRQKDYLETVRGAGDALLTLLNDILDYSKIEAGKMRLDSFDFDLRDIVERTVELVAPKAQQKGLEMTVSMTGGVPTALCGDAGRLRQILLNLLGNAVKFTERGEIGVTIDSRGSPERPLIAVSVRDSGIGISKESCAQLFQSFSQLDASATRRHGGTGLGLAISRQLAELMGGRMGVDSEVGRGSTFWFEVPFDRSRAQTGEMAEPGFFGVRALIIDDNPANRAIQREALAGWKVDSDAAVNAEEGLTRLREAAAAGRPYQLALVDLQMPGLDGLALAGRIKSDPALRDARVVLMTPHGGVPDEETMANLGIFACIAKPVRESVLLATFTRAFSGREDPPEPAAPTLSAAGGRRLRVLVVEDNSVNQKVVMLQLQKLGHSADAVGSGSEALDSLGRIGYDLVLMDCQMPDMDGYDATRELRRREAAAGGRRTPVVALTASAMPEDRQKCADCGMDDYLAKPVRLEDLGRVLASRASTPVRPETIRELIEMAGEKGFASIREEFLSNTAKMLAEMAQAAKARDDSALKAAAHSLKGSSGSIGAAGLQALCRELEELLSTDATASARAGVVARMNDEFFSVRRALVEGL
jgi:PAS domain S-box-containing protein